MEKERKEELYGLADDWRIRKIFKYLERRIYTSFNELAEELGFSKGSIRRRVREMENANLVNVLSLLEADEELREKETRGKQAWNPTKRLISLKQTPETELFKKILENYKLI